MKEKTTYHVPVLLKESIEIISEDKMKEGDYGKPIRFGRPSKNMNENGYSDHFPIGMKILEKVE